MKKLSVYGLTAFLLGAVIAFWPPQRPDLDRLPAPTVSPVERPDRPPHPLSAYTPPGR